MKTNIVLARRLVTIFIGMCIITFSSAWDYPWEETSVYGTWDAPNMTYVIEKSQEGPSLTIRPRGDGWMSRVQDRKDGGTRIKWLEPSGQVESSYSGKLSVGEDSVVIEITSSYMRVNDLSSWTFELSRIEASLKGKDTLEGIIVTGLGNNTRVVTTNRFLAGRRK